MTLNMKELLTQMLNGWLIREASWGGDNTPFGGSYQKNEIEAMTEACGGDRMKGELLVLFSYWSNDISDIAAHYGIAIIDGKVVDIAPPPTPEHWWDHAEQEWREPSKEEEVL